jgi:hypothetical protein
MIFGLSIYMYRPTVPFEPHKGLSPLESFAARKAARFSQAMDIVAARSLG